jgi:hypothetical protein
MSAILIILVVPVVLALSMAGASVRVVREYERGVVSRLALGRCDSHARQLRSRSGWQRTNSIQAKLHASSTMSGDVLTMRWTVRAN